MNRRHIIFLIVNLMLVLIACSNTESTLSTAKKEESDTQSSIIQNETLEKEWTEQEIESMFIENVNNFL